MQENSFEWFNAQVQDARNEAARWPDWMKNNSDIATASFPIVSAVKKNDGSTVSEHQALTKQED